MRRVQPRSSLVVVGLLATTLALVASGCADATSDPEDGQSVTTTSTSGGTPDIVGQSSLGMTGIEEVDEIYRGEDDEPVIDLPSPTPYYEIVSAGDDLPDGETCAAEVRDNRWLEHQPDNVEANNHIPASASAAGDEFVVVDIDGAEHGEWNDALAPRIDGNFTGTTEQILRWGACKWGFDEDLTYARAVTESSWQMATAGDVTDSEADCETLGLDAPCPLSYGLLQVKGSIHLGTYPRSQQSTAFGVDYAMAWLRACYEGAFTWLADDGYEAGDQWGCVGAWFSGEWYDDKAIGYIDEVRGHLDGRTWESYLH